MAVRQRRYSKEEIARRGQELYESGIRQQIEAENEGKIVAVSFAVPTATTSNPGILKSMKPSSPRPIDSLNAVPTLNLG
jgi:hypothetical protein